MTRKKTNEEYMKEILELTQGEYCPVTPYVNSATKLQMKHVTCGTVWEVRPNNFKTGTRCPKCAQLKKTKTTEQFSQEVQEVTKGALKLVGEYLGCDIPTEVVCTKHSLVISTRPTSILKGKQVCPKCNAEYLSKCQRKDHRQFTNQLQQKHKGRIIAVESYINTHTKITFRCTECTHEFKAEPNSVLRLSGCPRCKQSKGERLVADILEELNVSFETQRVFPDCVYKRALPFDFYLADYNLLIEFDGEQHYRPIEFFGGAIMFEYQQERDKVKTEFAKVKGFTLIRLRSSMSEECIRSEIQKVLQEVKQKPYQIGYDIV